MQDGDSVFEVEIGGVIVASQHGIVNFVLEVSLRS